jgi:hypothetical protein
MRHAILLVATLIATPACGGNVADAPGRPPGTDTGGSGGSSAGGSSAGGSPAGGSSAGGSSAGGSGGASPSCSAAQQKIAERFATVFVAGASNSLPCSGPCKLATLQSDGYYYGLVVSRAWQAAGACGAAPPKVVVGNFDDASAAPEGTTLALAVDAFYHPTTYPIEQFFEFVEDYTIDLVKAAPQVSFFGATVPKQLAGTPQPASYNSIIRAHVETLDQVSACAGCTGTVLDIDGLYQAVLAGAVTYDGKPMTLEDTLYDGLHLNPLGHRIVADAFIAKINERHDFDIPPYGELVIAP